LRVLVVEDNEDIVELLLTILGFDGHHVEVATTGLDAVPLATRFRPHVVLCDLGLPGKDGYAIAEELRARPQTAAVGLIAISGYGTSEHRRRSLRAGFDLHLTKPLEAGKLLALVAELAGDDAADDGSAPTRPPG
jgi:CheY-like chemotaxis protein